LAVIKIVEDIHQNYPQLAINQLKVLLRIIAKPGVRASDLQKEVNMSKSTVSWMLRTMGTGPYLDDASGQTRMGLNLISQVPDPMDGRAKLLAPTALGRRLGDKIEEAIGEAYGKTKGPTVAS
jgi:DNA-binding MarR family transcriptional regulator